MWQYNHTPDPDTLMHYGIKGMKWDKAKRKISSMIDDAKIERQANRRRNSYISSSKNYNRKAAISDLKSSVYETRAVSAWKKGKYGKSIANFISSKSNKSAANRHRDNARSLKKHADWAYEKEKKRLTKQSKKKK